MRAAGESNIIYYIFTCRNVYGSDKTALLRLAPREVLMRRRRKSSEATESRTHGTFGARQELHLRHALRDTAQGDSSFQSGDRHAGASVRSRTE